MNKPNGKLAEEFYRRKLLSEIKRRYLKSKVIGVILMVIFLLCVICAVRVLIPYRGRFVSAYLPVTALMIFLYSAFSLFLLFKAVSLFVKAFRLERASKKGNFYWEIGRLIGKSRRQTFYIDVGREDTVSCIPLGINQKEFENAAMDDEYMIIQFNKPSIIFAIRYN